MRFIRFRARDPASKPGKVVDLPIDDSPDQAVPTGSSDRERYNMLDGAFWPGSPCNHLTPRLQWHKCVTQIDLHFEVVDLTQVSFWFHS
jgi:hypothetical protein